MVKARYNKKGVRVVSLAPSCTELVFALGRGDSLIARTAFCDFPVEAARIPAVGGWTTANVENVLALRPDLVLTSTVLQAEIVTKLQAAGMTVCHTDPRTLADVLQSFGVIAKALGVPEEGRALRERMEAELLTIPQRGASKLIRVYAEEWPKPPMASGNWVPGLIQLNGGISLLPAGERSRTASLDEVRSFDPDVVMLNYCGMKTSRQTQVSSFRLRPGWRDLRAVRGGRIVVLDDSLLNRPGPRLVDGAHALTRSLAAVRV